MWGHQRFAGMIHFKKKTNLWKSITVLHSQSDSCCNAFSYASCLFPPYTLTFSSDCFLVIFMETRSRWRHGWFAKRQRPKLKSAIQKHAAGIKKICICIQKHAEFVWSCSSLRRSRKIVHHGWAFGSSCTGPPESRSWRFAEAMNLKEMFCPSFLLAGDIPLVTWYGETPSHPFFFPSPWLIIHYPG